MSAGENPKVSVVAITYNHAAFIGEAIEGFLAQETDFPVEFIVADDASTDDTADIVRTYADRYPDRIKPILRDTNVGIGPNLLGAIGSATGQYLALCEGDYYWIDPSKLARQAALLDERADVSVCFHPVRIDWHDSSRPSSEFPPAAGRQDVTLYRLIISNFIQTNSVMYRTLPRDVYESVPTDILPLDWHLHLLHARHGEIAMLPEVMSVYRKHEGGVWAQRNASGAFWDRHGDARIRGCEALSELFRDDPARGGLVARHVAAVFRDMAVQWGEGPGLAGALARHPEPASIALTEMARQLAESRAVTAKHRKEIRETRAKVKRQRERNLRLTAEVERLGSLVDSDKDGLVQRLARGFGRGAQ